MDGSIHHNHHDTLTTLPPTSRRCHHATCHTTVSLPSRNQYTATNISNNKHRGQCQQRAHHEDSLGGPLVQVVDPRPRSSVEPSQREKDVHLLVTVGASVADHGRVRLIVVKAGDDVVSTVVGVPDPYLFGVWMFTGGRKRRGYQQIGTAHFEEDGQGRFECTLSIYSA